MTLNLQRRKNKLNNIQEIIEQNKEESGYPSLYTYETDDGILIVNMKELLEIISRLDWKWLSLPFGEVSDTNNVRITKAKYNGIEILVIRKQFVSEFSVSISLENLQNLIKNDKWRHINISPQNGETLYYVKRLIPFDELPQEELERIFHVGKEE